MVDLNNFYTLIKNDNVIAHFTANWCGPSKRMDSILNDITKTHSNIKTVSVDIDLVKCIGHEYQIEKLPTFIYFQSGKEIKRITSASKWQLIEFINPIIT
ncbi:thioredoxin H-type 1-like [Entamoeba marina]